MKRELILLLLGFFLFSCTVPLLSAEIFIKSDLEDNIYNIEDEVGVNFSVERQGHLEGFVDVYLECGRSDFLTKREPISINGEKKTFSYSFSANIKGACILRIELLDNEEKRLETEESKGFRISDNIDVDYTFNKKEFSPGERININGTAIKDNGEDLEGFIQVSSDEILDESTGVDNGSFSFESTIEERAYPGQHNITFYAYEKNKDERVINEGEEKANISVKSVPFSISVLTNKSELKPPQKLSMGVEIYDQVNNTIEGKNASVEIFPNLDDVVFEKNIDSGSFFNYSFQGDASPGIWFINTSYKELSNQTLIRVLNNSQIEEEWLEGATITLKNVGNVDYSGDYMMNYSKGQEGNSSNNSSNEINLLENISLKVGENKTFDLGDELENGTYNITTRENTHENVEITGNVVAADIDSESYIPALIILAIVIAGFFIHKKRKEISGFIKKKVKKYKEKKKKKKDKKGQRPFDGIKGGEETKEDTEETIQRHIHMAFFNLGDLEDKINLSKITKRKGFTLKKMREGIYFVLHYSKNPRETDEKLVELAREVRLKSKNLGKEGSIVINSERFFNKASFLRDFSLETRMMLDYIEKGILVSENVYKKIGLVSRQSSTVRVRGELVNVYKIN